MSAAPCRRRPPEGSDRHPPSLYPITPPGGVCGICGDPGSSAAGGRLRLPRSRDRPATDQCCSCITGGVTPERRFTVMARRGWRTAAFRGLTVEHWRECGTGTTAQGTTTQGDDNPGDDSPKERQPKGTTVQGHDGAGQRRRRRSGAFSCRCLNGSGRRQSGCDAGAWSRPRWPN
jgi:hypothetical protein